MTASEDTLKTTNSFEYGLWTSRLFILSMYLFGFILLITGFGAIQSSEDEKREHASRPIQVKGLRCENSIWNFGVVDSIKTRKLTHDFTLINHSKNRIKILKVVSSCGCMIAENYTKEIEPNQKTDIQVTVELPPLPGYFNKNMAVSIEDHVGKAVIPLHVQGEIELNCGLFSIPEKIDFGILEPEEVSKRTIHVFRHDLSPVIYQKASSTHPNIKVSLKTDSHSDVHKATFEVSLSYIQIEKKTEQATVLEGQILFETKHNECPTFKVPFIARFSGDSLGSTENMMRER